MRSLRPPKYFIGMNGGLATKDPETDLALAFQTAHQLDQETDSSPTLSRMAPFYPQHLTSAVSGWMDTGVAKTCLMMHDDFGWRGCRIRDYIPAAGQLEIAHETLTVGASSNWNSQASTLNVWKQGGDAFVAVWQGKGDIIGEELGLNWRKWFHSTDAAKAIIAARPRDRADTYEPPYVLLVNSSGSPMEIERAAGASGISETIEEMGLWFTFLQGLKIPCVSSFITPNQNNDEAAEGGIDATHVGRKVPSGHGLLVDAAKRSQFLSRRTNDGIAPVLTACSRLMNPFDGAVDNLWVNNVMGGSVGLPGARVKNHADRWFAGYLNTSLFNPQINVDAAGATFDGTNTIIPLNGTIHKALREIYTSTAQAGIAGDYHGWLVNLGNGLFFAITREASDVNWLADSIAVDGNHVGSFAAPNALLMSFIKDEQSWNVNPILRWPFIPGYDTVGSGEADDFVSTALCGACDEIFNPAIVGDGVFQIFIQQTLDHLWTHATSDEWMMGITFMLDAWRHLYCFEISHVCFGQTTLHEAASIDGIVTYRAFLNALRTQAIADYQGNFPSDTGLLLFHDVGPADWLIGESDGSATSFYTNDLTTTAGGWGHSPFWETALGDWMRAGYTEGNNNAGTMSNVAGVVTHPTLEAAPARTGLYGQARQVIASEWMTRKSISMGADFTASAGIMGDRSDGRNGYTIFSEDNYGLKADTQIATWGIAHLIGSLLRLQEQFSYVNFRGRRMRSLALTSTAALSVPQTVTYGRSFDGLIGITEDGALRQNVLHTVYQNHLNPRQLIAVFVNDWKERVGDTFQFTPAHYTEFLPATAGWYKVTKYVFTAYGFTTEDLGHEINPAIFPISIGPSEVYALVFDFESGLNFDYRYDDAATYTSVPIPTSQERHRIEDIHGDGERFQFGFRSDLPDEEIEITAMMMRVFPLGRSQTQG